MLRKALFPIRARSSLLPLPVFDHFLDDFFHDDALPRYSYMPSFHTPKLLIRNRETCTTLELELPRFSPKDVSVKVNAAEGTLSIKANRREKAEDRDADDVFFGERSTISNYERTFQVDKALYDLDKVTHALEDGVLRVVVPLKPQPTPRLEEKKQPESMSKVEIQAKETNANEKNANGQVAVKTPHSDNSIATANFQKSWPPKFQSNETDKTLEYVCTMPATIKPESIRLELQGNAISFCVNHQEEVEKHDQKGNVVFSSSRSVGYSTPLYVPRGTTLDHIKTSFQDGTLRINIEKTNKEKVGTEHSNL